MNPTLLDYICLGGTAAVWIIGASYNRRVGPRTERPSPGWYGTVSAVAIFWIILAAVPGRIWPKLVFHREWLVIAGSAILVVSAAFTVWARLILGRMWSGAPLVKEGHELRTDGPYRVTRHPIYTGMLGMVLGVMLEHDFGKVVPFLIVVIIIVEAKIRLEEKLMLERFGERYVAYKREVPQLIPGVKWFRRS